MPAPAPDDGDEPQPTEPAQLRSPNDSVSELQVGSVRASHFGAKRWFFVAHGDGEAAAPTLQYISSSSSSLVFTRISSVSCSLGIVAQGIPSRRHQLERRQRILKASQKRLKPAFETEQRIYGARRRNRGPRLNPTERRSACAFFFPPISNSRFF